MTAIVLRLKEQRIQPAFLNGARQYEVDDRIYEREVVDAIDRMGRKQGIPVMDSYRLTWTGDKKSWLCFDDLNFNNDGQVKMAKAVLEFLAASRIGR